MINNTLVCGCCRKIDQKAKPLRCIPGHRVYVELEMLACSYFHRCVDVRFSPHEMEKIYARRASDLRKDL